MFLRVPRTRPATFFARDANTSRQVQSIQVCLGESKPPCRVYQSIRRRPSRSSVRYVRVASFPSIACSRGYMRTARQPRNRLPRALRLGSAINTACISYPLEKATNHIVSAVPSAASSIAEICDVTSPATARNAIGRPSYEWIVSFLRPQTGIECVHYSRSRSLIDTMPSSGISATTLAIQHNAATACGKSACGENANDH